MSGELVEDIFEPEPVEYRVKLQIEVYVSALASDTTEEIGEVAKMMVETGVVDVDDFSAIQVIEVLDDDPPRD